MRRGERRDKTDKVAKRRFKEAEIAHEHFSMAADDKPSAGYFRKKNPFTFPKVAKRGWEKKLNEKQAIVKEKRRSKSLGTDFDE